LEQLVLEQLVLEQLGQRRWVVRLLLGSTCIGTPGGRLNARGAARCAAHVACSARARALLLGAALR
jgi:hypothetical protein